MRIVIEGDNGPEVLDLAAGFRTAGPGDHNGNYNTDRFHPGKRFVVAPRWREDEDLEDVDFDAGKVVVKPKKPKTAADIDKEIEREASEIDATGAARERAVAMLIVDLWAKSFGVTRSEARTAVHARLKKHLKTIRNT